MESICACVASHSVAGQYICYVRYACGSHCIACITSKRLEGCRIDVLACMLAVHALSAALCTGYLLLNMAANGLFAAVLAGWRSLLAVIR